MLEKFKIILFAYMSLFSLHSYSQNLNMGGVVELEMSKLLLKNLEGSTSAEWRQKNNFNDVERYSITGDLSYRFNQYLKVGGSYNYIMINQMDKEQWDKRHRFNLSAIESYKYNNLRLSLRERCQTTFRRVSKSIRKKSNIQYMLRNRFMIDYNIKNINVDPYIYAEMYNTLNSSEFFLLDRIRYEAGASIKLGNTNSIKIGYRYNDFVNPNIDDVIHSICLGYNLKL